MRRGSEIQCRSVDCTTPCNAPAAPPLCVCSIRRGERALRNRAREHKVENRAAEIARVGRVMVVVVARPLGVGEAEKFDQRRAKLESAVILKGRKQAEGEPHKPCERVHAEQQGRGNGGQRVAED